MRVIVDEIGKRPLAGTFSRDALAPRGERITTADDSSGRAQSGCRGNFSPEWLEVPGSEAPLLRGTFFKRLYFAFFLRQQRHLFGGGVADPSDRIAVGAECRPGGLVGAPARR